MGARSPAAFSCSAREIASVLHVRFAGDLDFDAVEEARISLREPLEDWSSTVVLDLCHVSFIDSAGLRLMIETKRGIERRGGQLLITPPPTGVRRLLEIAHLGDAFATVDIERLGVVRCAECGELRGDTDARCPACGA